MDGDLARVKKLVESGVDVNTSVFNSANPLTLAILSAAPSKVEESPSEIKRMTRLALVRYLIDNGADVNRGGDNKSPLAVARMSDDDKDLEQLLLNAGANPDTDAQVGSRKTMPKKVNAVALKLIYYAEASEAAGKVVNAEKQKIITGGN